MLFTPKNSLLLQGAILVQADKQEHADLRLLGGRIAETAPSLRAQRKDIVLPLQNCWIMPGLINAHDHLEFGLFPPLGKEQKYRFYTEWAQDVARRHRDAVKKAQKIPLKDRLLCSGYRNLLAGATSVAHHNPYHDAFDENFPVRVLRNFSWSHSLVYGQYRDKRHTDQRPHILHLGEGTDERAAQEIERFNQIKGFASPTIIVHGLGINERNIKLIPAKTGLIWCPSSNYFLYGQTADISLIKNYLTIALGTDSELTGEANLMQDLRLARSLDVATEKELWQMVTTNPAALLRCPSLGQIQKGAGADLIIFPRVSGNFYEDFFNLSPKQIELILINGRPVFGNQHYGEPAQRLGSGPYENAVIKGAPKFILGPYTSLQEKYGFQATAAAGSAPPGPKGRCRRQRPFKSVLAMGNIGMISMLK